MVFVLGSMGLGCLKAIFVCKDDLYTVKMDLKNINN